MAPAQVSVCRPGSTGWSEGLPCSRTAGKGPPGCPTRVRDLHAALRSGAGGRPGGPRNRPPPQLRKAQTASSSPRTRKRRPTPQGARLEPLSRRRQTPSALPHPSRGRQVCRRPPPARRHGNRTGRSPPVPCFSPGAAAAAGAGSGGAVHRSAPQAQQPLPLPAAPGRDALRPWG